MIEKKISSRYKPAISGNLCSEVILDEVSGAKREAILRVLESFSKTGVATNTLSARKEQSTLTVGMLNDAMARALGWSKSDMIADAVQQALMTAEEDRKRRLVLEEAARHKRLKEEEKERAAQAERDEINAALSELPTFGMF